MPIQQMMLGISPSGDSYWWNQLDSSYSQTDRWYAAMVTPDGENIYMAGDHKDNSSSNSHGLVAKYNKDGVLQWQRKLSGSGIHVPLIGGITQDDSGNVYAHGYQTQNYYGLIVKYNSSGVIQWQKQYYTSSEGALGGDMARDGNQIYTTGYLTGMQGMVAVKWNASGSDMWARQIRGHGGGNAEGNGIATDANNGSANVYVVGHAKNSSNQHQPSIIKFNTSGTLQWKKQLTISSNGSGYAVACDSNGNVIALCVDHSNNNMITAKINSSGALQWQRKLQGTSADYVCCDSSDNIYVLGDSGGYVYFAKYNSSGAIQFQRSIRQGSSNTYCRGITHNGNGSVVIAAFGDTGNKPALTYKLPDDGSKTGTYGDLAYAVSTLTEAVSTGSYGDMSGSVGSISPFNETNTSYTESAATLTSTTTDV